MNAERLHSIILALRNELEDTDSVRLISELVAALERVSSNPSDGASQEAISTHRRELNDALVGARSNEFELSWRLALAEMGIEDLLGESLRVIVDTILSQNAITHAGALEELRPRRDRLVQLSEVVSAAMDSFAFLRIGTETVPDGEFDVGLLIPRDAVKNQLEPLANELGKLDGILGPFLELSTGSRPDFEVRSISSSSFQIFLESPAATAVLIAATVERVIMCLERLQNIRLAQKQLADSVFPEDKLKLLGEAADDWMRERVDEIVEHLLTEYGGNTSDERKNELRTELKHSVLELTIRLDRGYQVEVNPGYPPEPEADASPEAEELRRAYEEVVSRREALKSLLKLGGSPLLSLPETTEESDDGDAELPARGQDED